MRARTPWIVTGSLAALAVAGGIGAAMAGPPEERELPAVTTVQLPAPAASTAVPAPGAVPSSEPGIETAASPVVVSAASPVLVSAESAESAD